MPNFQNRCSLLLFVFLTFCTSIAHADFREADKASAVRNWGKVYQLCKAEADLGEKNCQSHLGNLYKYGRGVEKNLVLSAEYLKKCADQQQRYCEEMLGDSYRNGLGVPVDFAQALRLFRLSSAKGNPWAYNNLGNMYRAGQGVPKDPAIAAQHFRSGADLGNGLAQASLADLYRTGDGVEKNGDLAFQWAQKSSSQNFGPGWNILGLLYRDGLGVRQNTEMAIESFKKAFDPSVNHRSLIAYANLGALYYSGRGVPVNRDEAIKWAEDGVKNNNRESKQLLAILLAQGTSKTPANPARAFQLAQEADQQGLGSAAEILGWFYRDGVGTAVDIQKSFRYFFEAREKGILGASVHLGRMYLEGIGVSKDPFIAKGYLLEVKSKLDQLGPGNRKFAEAYFASLEKEASQPVSTAAIASPPTVVPAAPASSDNAQQILLERLEKMQKQLESLQASTNTIQHSQIIQQNQVTTAPRKALVIGNDSYRHVTKLTNAKKDATAIAKSLGQLGYTVSLHLDTNEKSFKQALRVFRGSLDAGDEVLFYFAGHGVQLGSSNYLLATDTKGDNEEQVKDDSVELQRVLDDLKTRNSKFALAIIDACRDNPFKQSGRTVGGRGLAPTTAATGQMIMFSAGAGQQALDKLGSDDKESNGVFTRVLLKEMSKPGIPVDRVLRNVRNEVVRLTRAVGHEQTPALYDQAVGDFYFTVK